MIGGSWEMFMASLMLGVQKAAMIGPICGRKCCYDFGGSSVALKEYGCHCCALELDT